MSDISRLFDETRLTPLRVFIYGLIIAFLALSPAILPYGGAYITRGDYIEQQLPFLTETQRILRNGFDAYSFNTFLGAPAVGSYAFYTLGSPFVWPLALLPKAFLPYGISMMAVLKHAVCMLTAFLYFRKMISKNALAFLGSVLYTFSSFTIVNTQFYHFTEVIAFFPLILLGFEQIMIGDSSHPGLLSLFCGLNTLTNYYFMFGSALLTAFYIAFRFFSPAWKHPRRFQRLMTAVFESIIGCMLAGILLCPAMLYMLQITRTGSGANLLKPYSLPDILERLRVLIMPIESNVVHAYYGDASSWTSTAAWLPLFGFTGTFCLLTHRFSREIRWLKLLILTLLIISFVPVLCGLFAMESNTTYTRWWYGLVLMMALATISVLDATGAALSDNTRSLLIRSFYICTAVAALLTLPFLIPEKVLLQDSCSALTAIKKVLLNRKNGAHASTPFILFSLITASVSGILFLICILKRNPSISHTALAGLSILIAVISYAGYIRIGDTFLKSGGEHPARGIYELTEIAEPSLSALALNEPQDYTRIDYGLKLRNYGLLRGSSSLTIFHSLRQSITGRFISMAGFGYDESTTIHSPETDTALYTFLSVSEYHHTDNHDSVPEEFVYTRKENGFDVYANSYQLPMGFLQTVCTGTHEQPMNAETIGQTLLAAVALDEPWLSKARETLYSLDVHHIPDWKESFQNLKEHACDSFETDAHGFTAHIRTDQAGYLIFTIPFDKGFSASIDGIHTEIIPCDVSFMSVYLPAGDHTVRFDYHTRGLALGILMSLTSLLILLTYISIRKRSNKSKAAFHS
ncbi:MAG: YfhO family protein [Clostridia bacterium]|nr:YfhO family protein [Clostridia bacterium]